jgi:hypothetical protein
VYLRKPLTKKKKTMQDIDLRSLARGYTTASVAALGAWATAKPKSEEHPEGVDADIKIRAIGMLLDRGWGKPNQPAEHKVDGEMRITIRKMLKDLDDV